MSEEWQREETTPGEYSLWTADCCLTLIDKHPSRCSLGNKETDQWVWILKQGWTDDFCQQILDRQPFSCSAEQQANFGHIDNQIVRADGKLIIYDKIDKRIDDQVYIPPLLEKPLVNLLLEIGLSLPPALHLTSQRTDSLNTILLRSRPTLVFPAPQ